MAHFWDSMDLRVLTIDFHDLEEGADFLDVRLLVNVDDIVKGKDACADAINFVNQLR